MTKFMELLEESVIIQGVVTLSLIGSVIFMYVTGRDVPQELVSMTLIALGFYFGGKVENTKIRNSADRIAEKAILRREKDL